MGKTASVIDRSRSMDEKSWWDLWNTSYRSEDNRDERSGELFDHVSGLVRRITENRPARILEVACGTGTLSRQLPFLSYTGLDLSAAAIEIARQKAEAVPLLRDATPPTYEPADFHDWPLPSTPFDLVVCVDAISCFREQAFVLRKMAQSLSSGGTLVLTGVNPFVYNRIRRNSRVRLESGPVSHWLSARETHALVAQAGLELRRSYTIMPRGNKGILRLINSRRLDQILGRSGSVAFRRLKEMASLGQYRVVIAQKK